VGGPDPDGSQLRRQGAARAHQPARLRALRWALLAAAQRNTQGEGPLAETFERIAERRGRQIAKVAVARKILTLCFYGLRDGEIRCLTTPDRASAIKVMAT
jgi:hypothetical protein